jgi:hypothetical protein
MLERLAAVATATPVLLIACTLALALLVVLL